MENIESFVILPVQVKDKFKKLIKSHRSKFIRAPKQTVEAKKNERANVLKEVKCRCKDFGLTDGMLKGALSEGRKKK